MLAVFSQYWIALRSMNESIYYSRFVWTNKSAELPYQSEQETEAQTEKIVTYDLFLLTTNQFSILLTNQLVTVIVFLCKLLSGLQIKWMQFPSVPPGLASNPCFSKISTNENLWKCYPKLSQCQSFAKSDGERTIKTKPNDNDANDVRERC